MKKISAYIFLCLFAVTASAQSNDVKEAFTKMTSLNTEFISVPTVVEVPLDILIERNEFAVHDRESGVYLPNYYHVEYTQNPVPLSAKTNTEGSGQVLLDNDYRTSLDFSLPDTGQGTAEIVLRSTELVSSSGMVFSFAPNVARPLYVTLHAVTSSGVEEVVVAKTQLSSNRLLFPETNATQWRLQFVYAQPLRMSGVTLLQNDVEKDVSRTLRFLAQPDRTYDIFMNPDRRVVVKTSESGDLRNDEDVLTIETPVTIVDNILYLKADVDNDGIEDVIDNCVSLANEDQLDINNNGRGDACDDFDRDGRLNSVDNCPDDPNRRQEDEDGDGIGDVCDDEESRITEKYAWIPWVGLGFAALVMVTMFTVILRRPEEDDDILHSTEIKTEDENVLPSLMDTQTSEASIESQKES